MAETGAETINDAKNFENEGRIREPLAETDLGPDNQGSIGPSVNENQERQFIGETGKPENHKKPTHIFVCVDGRTFVYVPGMQRPAEDEANPQTAGSLSTTLPAAEFMTDKDPSPISTQTGNATLKATKSGLWVVDHGDEAADEGGCGARFNHRNTLGYISDKPEIVVPTVMTIAKLTGLTNLKLSANGSNTPLIDQKDLLEMLEQAGESASRDSLWDASPAEQVAISRQNGGQYVTCQGSHLEELAVATTQKGHVFDNQQYSSSHRHPETGYPIQAFAVAFGELKEAIFTIEDQNGGSELSAAKKTLAAFAFNVGTFKMLKNNRLKTVVY